MQRAITQVRRISHACLYEGANAVSNMLSLSCKTLFRSRLHRSDQDPQHQPPPQGIPAQQAHPDTLGAGVCHTNPGTAATTISALFLPSLMLTPASCQLAL
ncbi:TPA: hypothetical protein ACH3X2_005674 [Trebouxia sp. C0005]